MCKFLRVIVVTADGLTNIAARPSIGAGRATELAGMNFTGQGNRDITWLTWRVGRYIKS